MHIFKHKVFFLEWVNTLKGEKFDLNASHKNYPFFLVTTDGETIKAQSSRGMLDNINSLLGDVIDVDQSRIIRNKFYIVEKDGDNLHINKNLVTASEEKALREKATTSEDEPEVEVVEETKEDTVDVVEEELVVEEVPEETVEVDWEWIGTLKNNKQDKEALDTYAEDKLGIKLSRAMKLDNMIKKLKEELGV